MVIKKFGTQKFGAQKILCQFFPMPIFCAINFCVPIFLSAKVFASICMHRIFHMSILCAPNNSVIYSPKQYCPFYCKISWIVLRVKPFPDNIQTNIHYHRKWSIMLVKICLHFCYVMQHASQNLRKSLTCDEQCQLKSAKTIHM